MYRVEAPAHERRRKAGRYIMAWSSPSHYSEYMSHLENPAYPEWEKVEALNTNGTAYVVHDRANDVYALQSYSTICAVQVGDTSEDLGKWSVTTSRHQGMFRSWCRSNY